MAVHDGHRERVRKQIMQSGIANMPSHNVLEALLFYTNARKDTNELAHTLIDTFGSFSAVLDAPLEALMEVKGVGEITASFLKLLPKVASYYMVDKNELRPILDSVEAAGRYFMPRFVGLTHEELHVATLDDRRQVIRCIKLSEGIVNATIISNKRIIQEVLTTNATSVMLAHNHPAGFAIPSAGDISATCALAQALQQINVQLVDHLVIFNDDFVSMRDSGMLKIF